MVMKKKFSQDCNLAIGIDCEDVQRWRKMMPKLFKNPLRKLFSENEHKYCLSLKDPAPHYAARWCAKEALLKALSPFCKLSLRDIEVLNSNDGSPFFVVSNSRLKKNKVDAKLSMAHSEKTAFAVVLVDVKKFIKVSNQGFLTKL
jgi:phosphopantetheine--protein transferase-like protein